MRFMPSIFRCNSIDTKWPSSVRPVPRAQLVRRYAIIALSYAYWTPPPQLGTWVHKNNNNLQPDLVYCWGSYSAVFSLTLTSLHPYPSGERLSPVPVKYEHIYINPTPPYWNSMDTVNYNVHIIVSDSEVSIINFNSMMKLENLKYTLANKIKIAFNNTKSNKLIAHLWQTSWSWNILMFPSSVLKIIMWQNNKITEGI
jgi:hypothetical protein